MRYLVFFLLIIFLFSCEKKNGETFYDFKFYPVINKNNSWKENEYFKSIPITIKVESRVQLKNSSIQGKFEDLATETIKIFSEKDIVTVDTLIKKESNLIEYNLCRIDLIKTTLNNDSINDFYIVNIDNNLKINRNITKGPMTIYISGITKNNLIIKDSTIITLE